MSKNTKKRVFFAPAARQRLKRQPKSLSRAVPGGVNRDFAIFLWFPGGVRGVNRDFAIFLGGSPKFSSGGQNLDIHP